MRALLFALAIASITPAMAQAAPPVEKPLRNGELDARDANAGVIVNGEVIEVVPGPGGTHLYRVKLDQAPDTAVWTTTFVPVAPGQIKLGDRLAFKGYATTAAALDPSGKLQQQIGSETLLQAQTIQNAGSTVDRGFAPVIKLESTPTAAPQ